MRFKFVYLITFIFSFQAFAGVNLTQITQSSNTINSPLVINDTLVYLDQNNTLWFNRGSSKSSFKPTIYNKQITAYSPKKLGDSILFINQTDNNSLWKTDAESFTKVSDLALVRLSNYQSNLINSQIVDSNDIITTDGESINRYNIAPYTLTINEEATLRSAFICSFDSQTFVFRAISPNSDPSRFHFYKSGKISDLEFDQELTNNTLPNFLFQFENDCYYKYYDFVNKRAEHFKVNSFGEISTIQNPDEEHSFNDYFIFNEQLFTFLENNFGDKSTQLYKLTSGSNEPSLSYLIEGEPLDITSFWHSSDYFYVLSIFNCYPLECGPVPGFVDKLIVFDRTFNIVNTVFDDNIHTLSVEVSDTNDFLINRKRVNELTVLKQGFQELSIKDPNIEIEAILGGEQNLFIQGFDNLIEKSVIYKLSETPTISKRLNGLWVSSEWQSQGISLNTGFRPNNSEYIFAGFFLFKDGQPFWLAGNIDMDVGSESVTIDLFEFKGSSFLANDPGTDTEQIPFGSLTITPQSCNNINALIQIIDADSIELNMNRIINSAYDNICSD